MEGLEPPCLAALDPKSSASTNFATSAEFLNAFFRHFPIYLVRFGIANLEHFFENTTITQKKIFPQKQKIRLIFVI